MDVLEQQLLDALSVAVDSEEVRQFRLLTSAEAAELAGVTPSCIRQWVKRGHLRPTARNFKSRAWLYREDHVLVAERARRVKQAPGPSGAQHVSVPSAECSRNRYGL
ncbi:helix-turn-helix domain-containing protein [Streptomyces sp. UNOC14_S4]|uniref:helix-turn-helix domain-containing protein n=1 Tax=Streptomyces sp. UNOC14_S4 TaxID=2872340 RepID=UPI0027E38A9F|nr:helix-turn-helix domain-containing protein [Streptomyces sp. UNOC14_S4]MCC3768834.1 helix-turn-helix domain-containing protein [Streptomyces sp. UNOC14_S4]